MTPLTPAVVMDEQRFSDLRRRLRFESSDDDAPSTILQTMADADEVITILIAERDAARAERDALSRDYRNLVKDYADEVTELQAKVAQACEERDEAQRNYTHACQTIELCEEVQALRAGEVERLAHQAEVRRLTQILDNALPYTCPECGKWARRDEDGCCLTCGADVTPTVAR